MDTGAALTAAGLALTAESPAERIDPAGRAVLQALDCPLPAQPGPEDRHRGRLFLAAGRFGRLFRLNARAAPGLHFFGAEVPQAGQPALNAAGSGLHPLEAFESCVGEAIERLSARETEEDAARRCPPPDAPEAWLAPLLAEARGDPGWLPARRLVDGATVPVPIDLCLRRPPERRAFEPPWPLSNGCAAGPSAEEATLRGLLELIERDAVALWWRGGRPAAPIPLEDPAVAAAAALLARLRQGEGGRRSWLLDITTDLGVPAVAAVSFDAAGGGFCFGTAARPSLAAAGCAALMEMAQIELAMEVVEAKRRERGEAALNAVDRQHLQRLAAIDASSCPIVHPRAPPRAGAVPAGEDATLGALLDRLGAHGLRPLVLDLSRPEFGVPVIRVLCPGLEAEPCRLAGPRLAEARAAADTSVRLPGIPLMA